MAKHPETILLNAEILYLDYVLTRKDNAKVLKVSKKAPHSAIDEQIIIQTLIERKLSKCFSDYSGGKDNPKAIIRSTFLNCPLTNDEKQGFMHVVEELMKKTKPDFVLEQFPTISKIVLFWTRKKEENYAEPAINQCLEIINWKNGPDFPICDTEKDLLSYLKRGVAYWIGRDKSGRPIFVIRIAALLQQYDIKGLERVICFCFEYYRVHLNVPGVAETFTFIIDCCNVSLGSLPLSDLKGILDMLNVRYPFQLNELYLLHDSFLIQGVWPIVRAMLSDVQKMKIQIYKKTIPPKIAAELFDPSVLPSEYGGSRSAITTFYPFPFISPNKTHSLLAKAADPLSRVGIPLISRKQPLLYNAQYLADYKKKGNASFPFKKVEGKTHLRSMIPPLLPANDSYADRLVQYYDSLEPTDDSVSPLFSMAKSVVDSQIKTIDVNSQALYFENTGEFAGRRFSSQRSFESVISHKNEEHTSIKNNVPPPSFEKESIELISQITGSNNGKANATAHDTSKYQTALDSTKSAEPLKGRNVSVELDPRDISSSMKPDTTKNNQEMDSSKNELGQIGDGTNTCSIAASAPLPMTLNSRTLKLHTQQECNRLLPKNIQFDVLSDESSFFEENSEQGRRRLIQRNCSVVSADLISDSSFEKRPLIRLESQISVASYALDNYVIIKGKAVKKSDSDSVSLISIGSMKLPKEISSKVLPTQTVTMGTPRENLMWDKHMRTSSPANKFNTRGRPQKDTFTVFDNSSSSFIDILPSRYAKSRNSSIKPPTPGTVDTPVVSTQTGSATAKLSEKENKKLKSDKKSKKEKPDKKKTSKPAPESTPKNSKKGLLSMLGKRKTTKV